MTIKETINEPMMSVDASDTDSEDPRIKQILNTIVQEPRAFFKHQRQGEPDLSPEEKEVLARRLLKEKPDAFLLRYASFLRHNNLSYFQESSHPLIQDIIKEMGSTSKNKHVKNRRWAAWNRMVESEDPFVSREGMRMRYPALFEHYFGAGSIQKEISAQKPGSDCTLSGMIMEHAELERQRRLLRSQRGEQEVEEEEEDESEDESTDDFMDPFEEFKDAVCQQFLLGLDERFDYSQVDQDENYDDLLTRERDEEEKYFEEDE